jgi:hypothetical protein
MPSAARQTAASSQFLDEEDEDIGKRLSHGKDEGEKIERNQ